RTELRERFQYGEIAVRLDRIGDQCVRRKGGGKDAVVTFERGGWIKINRRADRLRQLLQIDIFRGEASLALFGMINRGVGAGWAVAKGTARHAPSACRRASAIPSSSRTPRAKRQAPVQW